MIDIRIWRGNRTSDEMSVGCKGREGKVVEIDTQKERLTGSRKRSQNCTK